MPNTAARLALALACLASPVAAQPAPGDPPPGSKAERQKNGAAKLAGLVAFVKASCPELQPDDDKLNAVVIRLGVDPGELSGGDLFLRAKAYAEIYGQDVPGNCGRAISNFGAEGTAIPGLIRQK